MRLNIQTKLAAILLGVGLPTLVIMGVLGLINGERSIRALVRDQLLAVNASKASHVESYFVDLRRTTEGFAKDPTVVQALEQFAATSQGLPDAENPGELWEYFQKTYPADAGGAIPEPPSTPTGRRLQELYVARNPYDLEDHDKLMDAGDGSPYSAVHRKYHAFLTNVRDTIGLNNVMLVEAKSRTIVYAVRKHADFQITLDSPALEGTNLKETAERALQGETNLVDFQRFAPAFNDPVGYISVPIRANGAQGGEIVGCLIGQFKIAELDRILSGDGGWEAQGLGKSGEAYIIGRRDKKMRTDARRLTDDKTALVKDLREKGISAEDLSFVKDRNTTVLAFSIDIAVTRLAAEGATGFIRTRGYTDMDIFAAYQPLKIPGLDWAIISRRSAGETLAPLAAYRRTALMTAAGVLLLIGLLSATLAKSFTAPIQKMRMAAQRFGQGERGIRLREENRDDEIGELAKQFNAMIEESESAERIQNQVRRNIVHDLKTPVTVIKGMGETLMFPEMAEDPTWREEMVRAIIEQSDRLLDDLRDILVPIEGDYVPESETFDLAILVEKVVKAEKHTSRAQGHEIIVRGTDAPISVTADRRKLRRVLENLLSNAIKYSPGQGHRVYITVDVAGNDQAAVSFRDEGLGMSPDQLATVLADGGRVASHASLGIEGTGFGLDSVQKVLRAHGGRLEVVSTEGRGSTFTAILPLGPGERTDAVHEQQSDAV